MSDANAATVSQQVLSFRIMILLGPGNTVSVIEAAVGMEAPVRDYQKRRRSIPSGSQS
jgi:hypothetical protein